MKAQLYGKGSSLYVNEQKKHNWQWQSVGENLGSLLKMLEEELY